MSKAFVREDDDAPDELIPPRASSQLPPGVKNFLTQRGERKLREELAGLMEEKRMQQAAAPAGAENQLKGLDQRIFQLQQALQSAEVVAPVAEPRDQVRFGATVAVRDKDGVESRYRIVGVDETDTEAGWVSWRSPIARALLNGRLGQRVPFKFPSGGTELEIISISYE